MRDQAYWSETHRQHWTASGGRYRVNRKAPPKGRLTRRQWRGNRWRSQRRARGEHAFHVVKRLWCFEKVRYRGLAKNLTRAFTMFGRPTPTWYGACCCRRVDAVLHLTPTAVEGGPVQSPAGRSEQASADSGVTLMPRPSRRRDTSTCAELP
jgi:hypothetical protein